jgi:Ser/Thr protein kinase RdoA (MazF antagonist)
MNGTHVVAIVDFTPFSKPVLFAIATAVYWYHLYGRPRLDLAAVRATVAAASERREWTGTETAAWPAMVALEALRVSQAAGSKATPDGVRKLVRTAGRYWSSWCHFASRDCLVAGLSVGGVNVQSRAAREMASPG